MQTDVLLLDEFGKGRLNEWSGTLAALVLNHRANHAKVTVLASNFVPDDLGKAWGHDGEAIADRLAQKCVQVSLAGHNYRRAALKV